MLAAAKRLCLRHGSVKNRHTLSQNANLIAQCFHFIHEVRRQENRQPLVFERFERFPNPAPRFCIKPGRQLVQKHQLRLPNQGKNDKQPLPFAARQAFYRRVFLSPMPNCAQSLCQSAGFRYRLAVSSQSSDTLISL